MLGRKERDQLELYMVGSIRQLIPDDHVLVRVDRVLDLSWLRDDVADLYSEDGRPGIDPEVSVRLMLAGFLLGIVHDRRLMREAAVNVAIRWFVGYGMQERLPDHSSLTRIRQRWGAERFRRIFERTVLSCVAAGIAKAEVVHVDASLIRADVSWESLAIRHADALAEADAEDVRAERDSRATGRHKKFPTTDPDASMATSGRNRRLEPSYKQHAVVDDVFGVVLDVEVTTGEVNEGQVILDRLDATMELTKAPIRTVTADGGYAYGKVFGGLERRDISGIIPTKAEPIRAKVPLRRFRYDQKHDVLRCPRGKTLRPGRPIKHGRFFHSRSAECRRCDISKICLSPGRTTKSLVVSDDHPALLRARRKRERWSSEEKHLYQRHRWRSEGFHGEAKTWHGLARAIRRGLANMRIQAFLTAAAVNLKRLAKALGAVLRALCFPVGRKVLIGKRCDRPKKAPLSAGFFNAPRVHSMRNLLSRVPKAQQSRVATMIREVFVQPNQAKARELWRAIAASAHNSLPKLAQAMNDAEDDVLAYMTFPAAHRQKLHSTNTLERLNKEVKRRADVVGIFPNEASIIRLVGAVLMEQNDEWQLQHRYLSLEPLADLAQLGEDEQNLLVPPAAAPILTPRMA